VPLARPVIPEKVYLDIRRCLSLPDTLFPSAEDGKMVTLQDFLELRQSRGRSTFQPEVLSEIESIALSGLPLKHEITTVPVPGRSLDDAVDYTRDFFVRQIKYLGPLREEPKALYPLQHSADPQDVGLHGEHTAAVLHRFRLSEIQYVPPSCFIESSTDTGLKVATLEEAVFEWLRYLDVAASVDTSDEGKFGYGLKVWVEGGRAPHDLTHVGVGVSQVLPIVVMCLLASRDTTIVLEQPELHLNPKVQTRLADFFLSLAMIQKQCLIETHSEYLINRLRLRAAKAAGRSVSELMKLYFVEKAGGFTTYRDVMINEFGSLTSWPKDFIDQNQREIEDILIAASQKATPAQ
jgi:predicted ATPase